MKRGKLVVIVLLAFGLMVGSAGANMLTNGDFNTALGAEWSMWGDYGWINQEVITPASGLVGVYDGTLQMSLGDSDGNGGRGMYQVVAASAAVEYTLNIQAGAQDWWLPNGSAYLKFLDAGGAELASYEIDTTASIHNPDSYDTGVAYQNFSISGVAPTGTTQIKVELAEWAGGGSAWFDNAVLVPEPATIALLGLGLTLIIRKK